MGFVSTVKQLACCLERLRDDLTAAVVASDSTSEATLAAGTVTVANTAVTAATRILFNRHVAGGTTGNLSYSITPNVGITFTSSSNTDTSTITYHVVQP